MGFKLLQSLLILILPISLYAQEQIEIELGPDEIAFNEMFTITVSVKNGRLKSYDNFPDITGLIKRGTSSSSSTNIVNGQISSSQSITQNYIPERKGTVKINAFSMKINDKEIKNKGKSVKIGPAKERARDPFRDPFDDIFSRRKQPQEFIDIKEDAFLALTSDKDEVYLGEGFTATIAFYVAESNRAPLQFYELGRQLSDILKKVKPTNCWEENFSIENINGEPVTIQGKRYTQYKIYQATYYPLNLEPIVFPSVGLEMIKFKVARNPSFFGRNRQEDFKLFNSKVKRVKVIDLPPHPLRERVSVGIFRLDESISVLEVVTGQSFNYDFDIYGEGNISAVEKPITLNDDNFDFYSPNIKQNINRRNNRVTGYKSFKYFGIPNEPGNYNLSDYFFWIFFNPDKKMYDTLTSKVRLRVVGESKKNQSILANDMGQFYDQIEFEDNNLKNRYQLANFKNTTNLLILLMLIGAAIVFFRKG